MQRRARRVPGRAGRGTSPRRTNAANSLERHPGLPRPRGRRPQRRAPALLQRRLAQLAACARDARDQRRIDVRELALVVRRLDAEQRVELLGARPARGRRTRRAAVSRAWRRSRSPRRAARPRTSATRRARGSRAAARAAAARASVVERTTTFWPRLDLEAVAGEQVGERRRVEELGDRRVGRRRRAHAVGVTAPARPGTTPRSARAARRARSGARPAVAARRRSSSSFWPSVRDAVDRPAHARGARTGTRPPAARRPPATAGCRRALARRRCASSASARSAARAPARRPRCVVDRRRLRRRRALAPARSPAHQRAVRAVRYVVSAAFSSWPLTSPRSGSAWPGPGRRGLQLGELADRRARLLGVLVERGVRDARRGP